MDHKKLFDEIDSLSQRYIDFWCDVCNIESPSSCKEGVDAVGEYFINKAKEMGWDVEVSKQDVSGNAVAITMNKGASLPPIALSGHIDTVHPIGLFGYPPVRREGNILYGPGVCDCKGGAVAAFLAMEALKNCGFTKRPVKLILQSDEEINSRTSNKKTVEFMAEHAKDCVAFLNAESATVPGVLILQRKGIVQYTFDISGVAIHSSHCYDGVSAIAEAAHKIIELEKWKDKEGITCNCGVISGGSVPNSVPSSCKFVADIRFVKMSELDEIDEAVKKIANTSYINGTSCTLTKTSERASMEESERNTELFEHIRSIFKKTGLPDVKPLNGSGGSDAADMTVCGIPTVDSIGVYGGRIHSKDEFAYVDSLAASAKMQAAVVYYFE